MKGTILVFLTFVLLYPIYLLEHYMPMLFGVTALIGMMRIAKRDRFNEELQQFGGSDVQAFWVPVVSVVLIIVLYLDEGVMHPPDGQRVLSLDSPSQDL